MDAARRPTATPTTRSSSGCATPTARRRRPDSTHYLYNGKCMAFLMRDQTVTTPVVAGQPGAAADDHLRTMRSVHGPVYSFATVGGQAGRLTKAHRRPGGVHEPAGLHAAGRERADRRRVLPAGHAQLPRRGELVLRRAKGHRLDPLGPVPAPRPGRRRRPARLGHGPMGLAGDPAAEREPARDQPEAGLPLELEQQGGAERPGASGRRGRSARCTARSCSSIR